MRRGVGEKGEGEAEEEDGGSMTHVQEGIVWLLNPIPG